MLFFFPLSLCFLTLMVFIGEKKIQPVKKVVLSFRITMIKQTLL